MGYINDIPRQSPPVVDNFSQEQRCPRCGGMLNAGPTGSITQWLRVCHCSIVAPDEPESDVSTIQICYSCGRRIGGGRLGSLTQWIFRPDFCDCEVPQPREVNEADFDNGNNNSEAALLVEDDQLELEVDSAKWPSLRYKPIALIGHGGFGTIYRCHDRLLNKTIALKMMRHLTPQQLVSFQQEARATSRLTHPNIVQVYDFGATENGAPFMTMEYVDGISLDQVLIEYGTLNVDKAINVFCKVCDALAHAHRAGVMHRDIKSSNVIVIDPDADDPQVKLIDFGVALFRTEEGTLHAQGSTIAGSPNYMAPDQVLGKSYDERSEVYGLGSTIFEALTGRTPFDGEHTLDTLRKQASMTPPKLIDIAPQGHFSEELEDLLARCLAKDQDSRFQSMNELKDALEAVKEYPEEALVEETEHPIPTPVVPPIDRKSVSHSSPIVVTIFFGLIFAGAVVGFVAYSKANRLSEAKSLKTAVPDIQNSVKGATETILEAEKPRFLMSNRTGIPWLISKGAVSDEDLIGLKGRTDYENLTLGREDIVGRGLVYIDAPIKMLILSQTPIADQYIPLLKKHKTLESLDIAQTKISDRGAASLLLIPNLQSLHIGGGKITDQGLIYISQIKHLKNLHLVDVPDVTVKGLTTLSQAPHLEYLALSKVSSSQDLSWLRKLPHLKYLEIEDDGINDRGFEQLLGLHIQSLGLKNNEAITDNGLKRLARLKDLRELNIEGSPLVTKETVVVLKRSNPGLQINLNQEEKEHKKRNRGFEAETGDVLKDMLEINATDRKLWHRDDGKKDGARK